MAYPNKYVPNKGQPGASAWVEFDEVTADNMNHIEDGIYQAEVYADAVAGDKQEDLRHVAGYDPTGNQVLRNEGGTLRWTTGSGESFLYGGLVNNAGVATLTSAAQSAIGTTDPTISLPVPPTSVYESLFFIADSSCNNSTVVGVQGVNTGDWLLVTGSSWDKVSSGSAIIDVESICGRGLAPANNKINYVGTPVDFEYVSALEQIEIRAVFAIHPQIQNGFYDGAYSVQQGGSVLMRIQPYVGYQLPSSITISGAQYTYNASTGDITLSNPTQDISVIANCVAV